MSLSQHGSCHQAAVGQLAEAACPHSDEKGDEESQAGTPAGTPLGLGTPSSFLDSIIA